MDLLYTFFIAIYQLLLRLVSLWHPKAKALLKGRKETWSILQKLPKSGQNRFWFHCASLGEYDMALPVIEACLAANPVLEIVVSFYSPSGMQHFHKRGFKPLAAFYLPADMPRQMQRLVQAVGATRLYLPKYEFWPNLLTEAQKAQVEIYSVSTLLRPSQVYFKWYGGFFRKALQCVSYFGVQNQQTQQLLLNIGILPNKIEMVGDLRFNRVLEAKNKVQPNAILEQFAAGSRLLILGSTWPQEEKILFDLLRRNPDLLAKNRLKVLIAPHDISAAHISKLLEFFPGAQRFSVPHPNLHTTDILILDTIGHLSAAYQYGTIAFIGGGFSGSLHNILEPLAFGVPVLFGPKHQKFPEAQQFLDLGFAHVVAQVNDLEQVLDGLLGDQQNKRSIIENEVFNLQVKIPDKLIF